jgi:hypothetical protein
MSAESPPMIKSRSNIQACKEEDDLKAVIRDTRRNMNDKKKDCEQELFSYILRFFSTEPEKNKIRNLIEALYNLYKHKKKKEIGYQLSLNEFIHMFPRDTSTGNFNFRRQHVFEAICKFMLLKNYDKNYWGNDKEFYPNLENYNCQTRGQNDKTIIDTSVNDGSAAQSVDIFFKIPKSKKNDKNNENKNEPSCNIQYSKNVNNTHKENKDTYILIQNKFYDNEKTAATKYDVPKIYNRSRKLTSPDFDNAEVKIILMVNSKESLDNKISKLSGGKNDFEVVNEILGLKQLDKWFQTMLYEIVKSKSFDDFLKLRKPEKPNLELRFHQDLFVETTYRHLTEQDESKRHKKFIWGAVPRSGKSYMIAGMINKRRQHDFDNDILVIMGAKSETESQFVDMFNEYDEFGEYGIIQVSGRKKNEKAKNIYIVSQEKLKIGNISKYTNLFEKKKVDVYFDEIHKGGSSEKGVKIIENLEDAGFNIDLFVMVTATFAKPMIAYKTILGDTKKPIVINWSYEDQQMMKQISNETKYQQFILSRDDVTQKQVIEDIFVRYSSKYGRDYLNILEDEYGKHPELVIIQPFIDMNVNEGENPKLFNIHGNLFKMKCSAISNNLRELTDPTKIFHDNNAVNNLLNFICNNEDKVLSENCIYGQLKHKYDYDVFANRHTQLWFLPDKYLYDNPEDCKEDFERRGLNKTDQQLEDNEENEDNKKESKSGLPNIEPLTRGLVLNLLKNECFNEFGFLIVHNQQIQYITKGTNHTKKVFEEHVFKRDKKNIKRVKIHSEDRTGIKEKITAFERQLYREGKSLIILTGSMLRLGVSLPCADIAFNFDGVKSIDFNYQTMFRVLTEREGKKYGYYFDFYPERAINFIYDYNDYYSNTSNTAEGTTKESLQSLLYLFNYNGLTIRSSKENTKETLRLYNSLINELKLTNEEIASRYTTGIKRRFERILQALGEIQLLNDMNIYGMDNEQNNVNIQPRKGEKKEEARQEARNGNENEGEQEGEEPDPDEEDVPVIIQNIALFLSTYVQLISLFSLENNCAGDTSKITDCIDTMIDDVNEKITGNMTLSQYCRENCSRIREPLACYMNLVSNYNKKKFLDSLNLFRRIFDEDNLKDEKIRRLTVIIQNIYTNIKEKMGKQDNLIHNMTPNKIQKKIEEYLPVKLAEKDKYGEVFTPSSLIDEMLGKLPANVWSNPNLKWLDPANGIGNFPMKVFEKLNNGLSKVNGYTDDTNRKEHIIKNMLYMVELNPKNVAVSRKIFGKDANIYCGSFLEDGWKRAFGIDKFDVIIGNPPWNDKKKGKQTGSRAKNSLWDKFIINSFNILNTNGYMGFIHPASWRGLGPEYHKIWELITNKQLLYLHIFGEKDGKNYFNVGSRFDIYVLQNKENTKATEVEDELGENHLLKLNEMPFLSNYAYKEINKVLTTEDKGIDVIMSYSAYFAYKKNDNMNENKTSEYKYPVVHSITQEGIKYWYSNTNTKGHFGVPKVILNFNRHQYSHPEQNDYKGKYGMSQISFGIPISSKKEGELILKAIETPDFKKIIAATKWGAFQTDYRMFRYFKKDWYNILLKKSLSSKRKTRKSQSVSKTKSLPFNSLSSKRTKSIKTRKSKTSACKGKPQKDCPPPDCLYVNGKKRQYCRRKTRKQK